MSQQEDTDVVSEIGNTSSQFDWSKTPLGPPDQWPLGLKEAVAARLAYLSEHPPSLEEQKTPAVYNQADQAALTYPHDNSKHDPERKFQRPLVQIEEALCESEEKYRTLFDSIDEGYFLAEAIFDENGKLEDILYLEANPAAKRLAGRDFTGRRMREIDPDYEQYWFDVYDRLVVTGEPIRAEHFAAVHGRWFGFYAFKIGGQESCRVATIFQDITERKRAEESLRESEKRMQLALQVGRSFTFEWRPKTDNVLRSTSCANILGLSGDKIVHGAGTQYFELIMPEDCLRFQGILHALTPAESSYTTEYRIKREDGTIAVLGEVGGANFDGEGNLERVVGVTTDITERKRAEEALRDSEALTSAFLEKSPIGLALLDKNGRIVKGNAVFRQYVPEIMPSRDPGREARWRGWDDDGKLIPPLQYPSIRALRGEHVTPGLEMLFTDDDGNAMWTRVSALPLVDNNGEVVGAISCIENIDQLKRTKAELKAERRRLFEILETLPINICILTADHYITFANRSFRDTFGDPSGRLCFDICCELDRPCDFCEAFEPLKTGLPHRWEFTSPDGSYTLDLHNFPFTDGDGSPTILQMSIDITERRSTEATLAQLNEELEQRVQKRTVELTAINKELESFCYSVTHELGAPLRTMNCFSTILLEEHAKQLDPEAEGYLRRIAAAASRMGHQVEDLLMLSRVTRRKANREQVNLSAVAVETLEHLKEQEPARVVEVEVAAGINGLWDPGMVTLVLQNLLGNAWKYTATTAGAKIEFGSFSRGDELVCFVRDNGIGFEMCYAEKIFLPFERLHRVGEFEGTGIGLATVQRIIDIHGGRVWAEAEIEKGATFYFTAGMLSEMST